MSRLQCFHSFTLEKEVDYLKQLVPTFTFTNWTTTVIGTQPMNTVLVAIQRTTLLASANFTARFVDPEAMRTILVTVHKSRTAM
jgi:hypothetical protein